MDKNLMLHQLINEYGRSLGTKITTLGLGDVLEIADLRNAIIAIPLTVHNTPIQPYSIAKLCVRYAWILVSATADWENIPQLHNNPLNTLALCEDVLTCRNSANIVDLMAARRELHHIVDECQLPDKESTILGAIADTCTCVLSSHNIQYDTNLLLQVADTTILLAPENVDDNVNQLVNMIEDFKYYLVT